MGVRKVSFLEDATAMKGKEKEEEHLGRSKLVWDCDSCLYDSFELRSFKRHLDSAITSSVSCRSNSMPHFASTSLPPTSAPAPLRKGQRRQTVLRHFSKLLQLIFRTRPTAERRDAGGDVRRALPMRREQPRPQNGTLLSIPEENDSRVRKTVSERFCFNASLGVSYA
uniref:Uncharacterized protein n=2 Tax=Nymphaea colorata TaxID=210225 RepID=A0A5K0WEB5_9MAGN